MKHVRLIEADFPWEFIIVDNGSTDRTAEVIHAFLGTFDIDSKYIFEGAPGNGAGRNRAISASRSDILIFTDDDCYVSPSLLTESVKVFDDRTTGYMSGRILLYDPTDLRVTINESEVPIHIAAGKAVKGAIIQGANMGFRKAALEHAGVFDPNFGAGSRFAGEDWELAMRVSAAGWSGGYYPGPLVWHHHGRKQRDYQSLYKFYCYGEGAVYAKGVLGKSTRWMVLRFWIRRLAGDILLRRSLSRILLVTSGALQYFAFALRRK